MSRPISSNLPDIPTPPPRCILIQVRERKEAQGQPAIGNVTPPGVMEGPVAAYDIMEGSIMLVLSRKVGESILISESIRVTVVQVNNGRIRLGIDAPAEVLVLREELTKSGFNSSPSRDGTAEALPPSAQLP